MSNPSGGCSGLFRWVPAFTDTCGLTNMLESGTRLLFLGYFKKRARNSDCQWILSKSVQSNELWVKPHLPPLSLWITWMKMIKWSYRKIPKISPRAYTFQRPFFEGLTFGEAYIRRGLSTEGNLRFKIDWASLIVGRKFTVFALFSFCFQGNFQVHGPPGGGSYIRRGNLIEGFLC